MNHALAESVLLDWFCQSDDGMHEVCLITLSNCPFLESESCDVSCVVASLCQLCLDPFFRSTDGFSFLIQKEWVALGHPFALRLHGLTQGGRQVDQMVKELLPTLTFTEMPRASHKS